MLKQFLYSYWVRWKRYRFRNAQKHQNTHISVKAVGYMGVQFEGANRVPERCNFSGPVKVGFATTFGYNNYIFGDVQIGNYCQIGADVALHATNHPMNYMTTYINQNLFNGALSELKEHKQIRIGHDVWIGHGVIIVGNVTIGNGAIIAAGSVVTKDVAPYEVVAGVPAKALKKRFSNTVIAELQALQWWHKTPEELEKIKPLFFNDLNQSDSIYHAKNA